MAVQRCAVQFVQGAYSESVFEELNEIFYIVQPNNIFKQKNYFDLSTFLTLIRINLHIFTKTFQLLNDFQISLK